MIKVRASQIFSHDMEDVVAAKKALDAGQPFLEIVEKYSTCPSKKNGGDLGWMPEGSLHSLMGESISENDKGKTIGPFHSPYGYHILKVTDIEVEGVQGPFTAETPMNELNRKFPDAHSLLFRKFHIGLPVSGYRPEETIASVARSHNQAEAEILNFLNLEYSTKHVPTISPKELNEKLQTGSSNVALLDIRERWERDIAKMDGSLFITKENFQSILAQLEPDQEVVLIDWKQDRSPSFQKFLAQRGFTQVKCLDGGIDAWADQVQGSMPRYEIDEDDGYRYEDIIQEQEGNP